MRKVVLPVFIVLALISATLVLIALGRGYRPDFDKKSISSTGLLLASSDPTAASVFVEQKLIGATNNTFSLPPGWYQVKIVKEGFLPWEKKMRLQGEIVSETQSFLFPSTPSLSPLTLSGVVNPTLSPDNTKIAYAVSAETKAGLWLLNLNPSTLSFSRDSQLIAKSTTGLDFSRATFLFSPDSRQILASFPQASYLLQTDKENQATVLSAAELQNLQKNWTELAKEKEREKLLTFPTAFVQMATQSAKILSFSLDENKVLYQATASATLPTILNPGPISANPTAEVRQLKPNNLYIYDLKEDKNYLLSSSLQSPASSLSWFPSSRHLLKIEKEKISVMEYDATNQTTIYSGPFEKFVASSPNAKKLIILTSYNREASAAANLYAINLR